MKYPKCQDYADLPWSKWHIIKSKKDVQGTRAKHFFTGKPCKHGHVALRFKKKGSCVKCSALSISKYQKTEKGVKKQKEIFDRYISTEEGAKGQKRSEVKYSKSKKGRATAKRKNQSKRYLRSRLKHIMEKEVNLKEITVPTYLIDALWANLQLKRAISL